MNAPSNAHRVTSLSEPAEGPLMDLDFIARHQIVERYLAGRLPLRGAQDFEQFCRRHPELLDAIGLSKQVNAALRLMEAGGKPEPWAKSRPRFYTRPLPFFVASVAALLLAIAAIALSINQSRDQRELADLKKQLADQPLQPTTSTREIPIEPNRTAPSRRSMATLFTRAAELDELNVDVSWSRYSNFRVLIDRVDQGRFAVLGNLQRDSNGVLRIAFNSTALGPGDYQLTVEGLDWKGNAEPQGWVTLTVAH